MQVIPSSDQHRAAYGDLTARGEADVTAAIDRLSGRVTRVAVQPASQR
jgi:hypothetical protein